MIYDIGNIILLKPIKNNDQTWKLNLCLLGLTLGFDEAEIKGIVTHIYD